MADVISNEATVDIISNQSTDDVISNEATVDIISNEFMANVNGYDATAGAISSERTADANSNESMSVDPREAGSLEEAEQAFVAESKIIDWMVNGVDEPNLSATILKELIKQRINDSLGAIGFEKLFKIDENLIAKTNWFNEELLGNNMVDFFHSKPTEYSKDSHAFSEDELF
jgi:hypothetical protein